jgi:hypothetical protein
MATIKISAVTFTRNARSCEARTTLTTLILNLEIVRGNKASTDMEVLW